MQASSAASRSSEASTVSADFKSGTDVELKLVQGVGVVTLAVAQPRSWEKGCYECGLNKPLFLRVKVPPARLPSRRRSHT